MKTIFRAYPDGEVIALFPEEPANEDPRYCLAFLHTGHFMPVIPEVVAQNTKPAEKKQFARTLRKLQRSKKMERMGRTVDMEHSLKLTTARREDLPDERVQENLKLVGVNALRDDDG